MGSALAVNTIETSAFSTPAVQAINLFIVTNTSDDPKQQGTLPDAITASNEATNNNPFFPNIIEFQIPGTGLQTIQLTSQLPTIGEPVVIDGYSQPSSRSNTPGTTYGSSIPRRPTSRPSTSRSTAPRSMRAASTA